MIKFRTFVEDMSGMSVGSGHKRPVDKGAGMTKKKVLQHTEDATQVANFRLL